MGLVMPTLQTMSKWSRNFFGRFILYLGFPGGFWWEKAGVQGSLPLLFATGLELASVRKSGILNANS